MEKVVAWNAGARVAVRVMAAVALWLLWMHYADVVAFRPPYGLWSCQIAHTDVIGDPFMAIALLGLTLLLLPASFGVVKLVETAARVHDRKRWLYLAAVVPMIALVTLAYALAIVAMLYPAPDYGAC